MTTVSSIPTRDSSTFAAPGPAAVDPPSLQSRDLPQLTDDADRIFAGIEALVKAKTPATGLDAVVQSVIKQVVGSLETGGMLDKFEVVAVAKDPSAPIVYFITKDGSVIATELNKVGPRANPQILGASFDFFGRFGRIDLKPAVGLVLPNGDCLLLING